MRIKSGRSADGLGGVVNEDVEAIGCLLNVATKEFYAGRVAQIQSMNLQAMAHSEKSASRAKHKQNRQESAWWQ